MSLILILAILTLSVASPATVTGGYGNGMVNVATDYDLGMNESKEGNLKDWHIAKVKDGDMTRLDVRCIWIYDDNSYVTFYVYDSPQDAEKGYENMMELFEKYDAIMEVGDNYFYGDEPEVCDAGIVELLVLHDNVILATDLEVTDYWFENNPDAVTDRWYMMDYVLENTDELIDFLYNEVLY